jgi:polar amino acid transport system permease protein
LPSVCEDALDPAVCGSVDEEPVPIKIDFGSVLQGQYLDWLLNGALTTIKLFTVAWVLAFCLALVLVAIRSVPFWLTEWCMIGYVEYHRNVPALVQLFVWYFAVPQVLPPALRAWVNAQNSEFLFALIALVLNAAAYMSEDLRSGIRSIPKEQMEAGRALGLSHFQTMRFILLPQAVRTAIPPTINQSLALFKTTSLAMAIGVAELTYAARQIENETYKTFEAFALASAGYLTISWAIMGLGAYYNWKHPPAGAR